MTSGGFIVIHRKIKRWPLYRSMNAAQRHVVTTLLLLANWQDGEFWYGGERIVEKRGELAHGLRTIAEESGASVKVVRTVVERLTKDGFLGTRAGTASARSPRVISIRNYDRFQSVQDDGAEIEGTPQGTPGDTREGTSRDLKRAPIEPNNQSTNKPTNQTTLRKERSGPQAELFRYWRETAWPRMSTEPYPENRTGDFVLLAKVLKTYSAETIRAAMDAASEDEWWRGKLDVATFCAKLPRFLPKTSPTKNGTTQTLTLAPSDFTGVPKGVQKL